MTDNYNSPLHVNYKQDEVDLRELIFVIWKGKWIILLMVVIFACVSFYNVSSKPDIYQAQAFLSPSDGGGSGGLAEMASQFGGLASFAGISLGAGGNSNKAMALAILQSRQFINAFIDRHGLLVPLGAGVEWDKSTDTFVLNSNLYDLDKGEWLSDENGKSFKPTDWQAYNKFKAMLSVSEVNGLTVITITHLSPTIAKQWVDWLVSDLNATMKQDSLDDTRRNITYLEMQVEKTNISDMRTVFYQLIEEQTKSLMLAEVQEEFAFKVIDPAVVPEEKAGPRRNVMVALAALLGFVIGLSIILVRFVMMRK